MPLALTDDICILTETWKKDDSKINLDGFWDFSQIRPKHKKAGRYSGGISLLCKDSHRRGLKVAKHSEGFIWVRLDAKFFNLENDVYLCALYIPPQHTSNSYCKRIDYFSELNEDIIKFSSIGNIIIKGDFNSRTGSTTNKVTHEAPVIDSLCPNEARIENWIETRASSDTKSNAYGSKLLQLCKNFNLRIVNGSITGDRTGAFTCHTRRGSSIVDYFICDYSIYNLVSTMEVLPPQYSSVHSPISMSLDFEFAHHQILEEKLPLPPRIKWTENSADDYIKLLSQTDNLDILDKIKEDLTNLSTTEELESCTQTLTDLLITNAIKVFKLKGKDKKNKRKTKHKPWFNKDCINLKWRLCNLSKLLQKSPKDPFIRGKFFKLKKEFKKFTKESKKLYETEQVQKLKGLVKSPKQFWKHIKSLRNVGMRYGNYISMEKWVEHFESLNSKDPSDETDHSSYTSRIKNAIQNQISLDSHCHILSPNVSTPEVRLSIKNLKTGKACGSDSICNEILKTTKQLLTPTLANLFSKILHMEYFPKAWSLSLIVPIHKSGELDDPNNFRGISLNSCVSKLFTTILNNRLMNLCEENKYIDCNQIGFRRGHRTSDHVFTLKTLIDQSFYNKKKLYTCFVDFRKAYDTVWRDGLLFKMLNKGISPKFIRLIRNMYSKIKASVQVDGGLSRSFDSLVGLKQGCNLSPTLFNIFVNDIISYIDPIKSCAPKLGNLQVSCLLYADDLVLLSESREGLQASLDALGHFTKDWFMEINPKKTKCLIFSKGRKRDEMDQKFKFGKTEINFCEEYCYLGVVFVRNGSLKTGSKVLHDKAQGAMFSLLKVVNKHRACKFDILLDLFDKLIVPIALYNSEVWGSSCVPENSKNNDLFDSRNISKLHIEKLQYKFLKMSLGVSRNTSNWGVLSETGRSPLTLRIFKSMVKFYYHMLKSPSELTIASLTTNINLANMGYNTWFKSLERILKYIGINHILYTSDMNEITHQIIKLRNSLQKSYSEAWEKERESMGISGSKINPLLKSKSKHKISKYLTIPTLIPSHRIALSKIRLGDNRFPIETGRYTNTPRAHRYCTFGCETIGDEAHYLFRCRHPFFRVTQENFLANIHHIGNIGLDRNCTQNDEHFVTELFSVSDEESLKIFGAHCAKVLAIFKELVG